LRGGIAVGGLDGVALNLGLGRVVGRRRGQNLRRVKGTGWQEDIFGLGGYRGRQCQDEERDPYEGSLLQGGHSGCL
jgi:hypothetical protein